MKLTVPPFPNTYDTPMPRDMAKLLVCALPEADRTEASDLLVFHILPVKLSGIDHHPRPQRLTAVVYKELARILGARPANMRLHALKLVAVETEMVRLGRDALNVSIVRFLQEHSGNLDAERLERWITPSIQELRMLSVNEIITQTKNLREELESWKHRVTAEHPAEWDRHRIKYLQVRATLEATEIGSYTSAAGSFYEFLRDADMKAEELSFE